MKLLLDTHMRTAYRAEIVSARRGSEAGGVSCYTCF